MKGIQEATSKKAKIEYGEKSLEAAPDISNEKLEELKERYLSTHINLNHQKIKPIELVTRQQSATAVWRDERKKRLTSSNFGSVYRRNPNIKVEKLVKRLLYPTFKGNSYTKKGLHDEIITIKEYKARKEEEGDPVTVEPVGLVICEENRFLAASPDGKVIDRNGGEGLIEIKNLLQNKLINLYEAASNKDFCLELVDRKLRLKRNHDYFFQVQGQMNIIKLNWVDFVVRTEKPYQLHVERIERDQVLWADKMIPKLTAFYFKAMLPELVAPTCNAITGIREPGNWYTELSTKKVSQPKITKTTKKNTSEKAKNPDNDIVHSIQPPSTSTVPSNTGNNRSRRIKRVKFVGRRISHEWIEDEKNNITKWYNGTLTNTTSGKDGEPGAVYEVLYDGEDEAYSVDHLFQDYQSSSLKFIDL